METNNNLKNISKRDTIVIILCCAFFISLMSTYDIKGGNISIGFIILFTVFSVLPGFLLLALVPTLVLKIFKVKNQKYLTNVMVTGVALSILQLISNFILSKLNSPILSQILYMLIHAGIIFYLFKIFYDLKPKKIALISIIILAVDAGMYFVFSILETHLSSFIR